MRTQEDLAVLPTAMRLPLDSGIPEAVTGGEGRGLLTGPWQQPYVSPLVHCRDDRDRVAWLHFCLGHHMEFLYWEATSAACDRAVAAMATGTDPHDATHWLRRVDALIRGSGAMLSYCGAFDPQRYDPLLRRSMAAQREDFSGDMSRDFLTMAAAKHRLLTALADAGSEFSGQWAAIVDAERYWYRNHGEVVMALHTGDSLLKEKLDALSSADRTFDYRDYLSRVVHGEEALADYDAYFGVERVAQMSLADYWAQAVAKVDAVHRHLQLHPHERALLMRGDAVLLAIVSERMGDAPT